MTPSKKTEKEKWIEKFLSGSARQTLIDQNLVKKGQKYSVAEVLQITKEELKAYLDQYGYPKWDIPKSEIKRSAYGPECELVWTFDEGIYEAHFIERGLPTAQYQSRDKSTFEVWWKNEELDEIYFSMCYSWTP